MKRETFDAIQDAEISARLESRMRCLDAMCAMTDDVGILAGLERLRKQFQLKWRPDPPDKALRQKRYADAAQDRTMKAAANRRRFWTAEDEAAVANLAIRDEDIALTLGRTLRAVRRKRDKLRAAGILKPNVGAKAPT